MHGCGHWKQSRALRPRRNCGMVLEKTLAYVQRFGAGVSFDAASELRVYVFINRTCMCMSVPLVMSTFVRRLLAGDADGGSCRKMVGLQFQIEDNHGVEVTTPLHPYQVCTHCVVELNL